MNNDFNIKSAVVDEKEHIELGKFYFLNNKYDEAIYEFKKVLEINSRNAEAYYNIGLIKEASNLVEEAKEMYLKALHIDPNYKIVRDKFNKLVGIEI
ncbi:MAG: tetratricopeptide repeat protein [Endomicrobium sp.]|jgi:tetratricopeptide (TPR) repeat protein|nr:tetratricopeptide repeat protein [Endomicrobium sp.]